MAGHEQHAFLAPSSDAVSTMVSAYSVDLTLYYLELAIMTTLPSACITFDRHRSLSHSRRVLSVQFLK